MTYKKLVELISKIKNVEEFDEACYQVDRAFDTDKKITWKDHEILYGILKQLVHLYVD